MDEEYYSKLDLRQLYQLYESVDLKEDPEEAELIFRVIMKKEQEPEEKKAELLAPRRVRLGASLLDFLISLPAFFFVLLPLAAIFGMSAKIANATPLADFLFNMVYILLGQVAFIAINGWLLYKNGQTVGKKMLGIKIVDLDHQNPGLRRAYLLRNLAVIGIMSIPLIGLVFMVLDILFILRKDKRCLHDWIAGTVVIKEAKRQEVYQPEFHAEQTA